LDESELRRKKDLMAIEADFRPIRIFGFILIGMGLYGEYFLSSIKSSMGSFQVYFFAIVCAYYFLTGLGVIIKSQWGYFLFLLFLSILILAFPIGTFISYKTFKYMKKKIN